MNYQAIQTAIYTRLSGYTALTDIVQSVGYSHPQDADAGAASVFPYVTIQDVTSRPWDDKDQTGGDQVVQVSVWARPSATQGGSTVCNAVSQQVYAALHRYALTGAGLHVVNCLLSGDTGVMDDPDGATKHRAMRFRVVYQNT